MTPAQAVKVTAAEEQKAREERYARQVAQVDQLVLAMNALSNNLVSSAENLGKLAVEARARSAEIRRKTIKELDGD